MKQCKLAKSGEYKGVNAPNCNQGNGCEACWKVFQDACDHSQHMQFVNKAGMSKCTRCMSIVEEEKDYTLSNIIDKMNE